MRCVSVRQIIYCDLRSTYRSVDIQYLRDHQQRQYNSTLAVQRLKQYHNSKSKTSILRW